MPTGKVKWFDGRRGYGFIIQESGTEIFVHRADLEDKRRAFLKQGEIVSFEVVQAARGTKAVQVMRAQQ